MKFIAGVWMVILGYTITYYGVSMWRFYTDSDGGSQFGIPFAVLMGLQSAPKANTAIGKIPHAKPPVNLGGTVYGTDSTASTVKPASTSQTGGTLA